MFGSAVRHWFGRGSGTRVSVTARTFQAPGRPACAQPVPATPDPAWPIERIWVNDLLWGEGHLLPGGEIDILRMASPLGLSAASSLLLLGAGSGGPVWSLGTHYGARIAGYEADADLAVLAIERALRANLGRRTRIETWDPVQPDFPRRHHHHAMALEAMRGGQPEPLLAAIAMALKPHGQLVLLELAADAPLDPADPPVARWARLEGRLADAVPSERATTRMLGRLGFDIRTIEDLSQHHMQQIMLGWRCAVRALEAERPSTRQAAQLVREAERWLLRLRLFRDGRLRLVRWHATGR